MDKPKMLRYVNILLVIVFVLQVLSVLLMGSGVHPRHLIKELHEMNGAALVIISIAHLILNWGWVKLNLLSCCKKQ